jgi:phosphoenolpyruvate carboxykinase (ATP)
MSFSVFASPVIKELQPALRLSAYINYQLTPEELIQHTLRTGEGYLSDSGALLVCTGNFTGRSPKDRFIVRDNITAASVDWNDFNLSIAPHDYFKVYEQLISYLNQKNELWIRDAYACADERFKLNIRLISETPWHNLFCYNMFLRPEASALQQFEPDWHVFSAPGLILDPVVCGTRQGNATIINFSERTILIAGSGYTGETKKGIFTILNYLMPKACVLSMHCAANIGSKGDTALFFGLSGTGKTTLSADPSRRLIGDDEHGWTEDSIFNFEGGCYAKTIDLKPEKEPEIYEAIRSGALLENSVFFKGSNTINYSDRSITENTRVSYPLHYISNAVIPAVGGIPKNIFFLTCDASGVLPPLSRLSPEEAMYQFISGYTAKIAGTETGITEPKPTFSACFGAPFLPLHPGCYAKLLGHKIRQHDVKIWLVNTGWTGGSLGTGRRIALNHTRSMITAVLEEQLNEVAFQEHPVFGMEIPESCPGVPAKILDPRNAWQDKAAYDTAAKKLAMLFRNNFEKYANGVEDGVLHAAPQVI